MLDLNFFVTRSDLMEKQDFPADSSTQLEESGTSNSSIVNAEETAAPSHNGKDEDSSNTAAGFIFDIMRKQKESDGANWVVDKNASSELATQPLFPVAGNWKDWDSELRLGLSTLARSPWLNFSFSESSGEVKEVKSPRQKKQLVRKSRRGPRSRSSQYRGVTFYRRTGRWESHIWDCGKQVYLGGFDTAHEAARAYDRAAIKFRGTDADINFNTSDYEEDIKQTKNLTKEEFVYILRRHSSRFSGGSSKVRASKLRKCGQWESGDNLDLSLGISKNSEVLIGNERMGFMDCHFNGGDKFFSERTKDHFSLMDGSDTSLVDGPRRQPQTAAMVSRQPSIFGSFQGLHQPSSSSSSLPQNGFANWAWRVKGSGMVSPVPIFTIAASSSGFSSFTTLHPF